MKKWLLSGVVILFIIVAVTILAYTVATLVDLPVNIRAWVATISGIVAFMGGLAELTGHNLRTIWETYIHKTRDTTSFTLDTVSSIAESSSTEDPSSLPPKPYTRLIGREEQISKLIRVLRDPTSAPIFSITGIGGIGKTALAFELAERSLQEQLFIKAIWFSAKQEILINRHVERISEDTSTYDDILNYVYKMITQKPVPSKRRRDTELNLLLKSKPYLIVIDNLETLQDKIFPVHSIEKFLYPSRLLLTSRGQLPKAHNVYNITIGGLREVYSIELIRQEANFRGIQALVSAKDSILRQIHNATGGMPLAIKLVVGEVLAGLAINTVLDRLHFATDEEELYRFIFSDLWNTLTDSARVVLVSMPAFATSANRKMLLQVSGLRKIDFDNAIMELVHKSLLDVSEDITIGQRRYSIHALTRNFVVSDLPKMFEKF